MPSTNETHAEAESMDLLEAVDAAIRKMQTKLKQDEWEKGFLTDLVRLLQLRKELDGDQPQYGTVRWVDECENATD